MSRISNSPNFKKDCERYRSSIELLTGEDQSKARRLYTKFLETAEQLDRSIETLAFSRSLSYNSHKELAASLNKIREDLEKITKIVSV